MRFFRKVKKKYIKLYYISNRSRAPKNESVRRVGDTLTTTTIAINVAFLLSFFFSCYFIFLFFSSLPVALESESCLFGKRHVSVRHVYASVCHVCVFIRQPVKDLFISFINFVAGLNAIVFIVVVAFFN